MNDFPARLKKITEDKEKQTKEQKFQKKKEDERKRKTLLERLRSILRREEIPQIRKSILEAAQNGKRECLFCTGDTWENMKFPNGAKQTALELLNLMDYPIGREGEIIADELVKIIKADKRGWHGIEVRRETKRKDTEYTTGIKTNYTFYILLQW